MIFTYILLRDASMLATYHLKETWSFSISVSHKNPYEVEIERVQERLATATVRIILIALH